MAVAPVYQPLDASTLTVQRLADPITCPTIAPFGRTPAPYMLTAKWHVDAGWSDLTLSAFAPLSIHPFASGLHYGIQAFEGLTVRRSNSSPETMLVFRLDDHVKRFEQSCARLSLPGDMYGLSELIEVLVRHNEPAVPKGMGAILYVRPCCFSTTPDFAVDPPSEAMLTVTCAVTRPFALPDREDWKFVLRPEFAGVRSWPGGVGHVKVGGNYAPTLLAFKVAQAEGFQQLLWLFPESQKDGRTEYLITEAGMMNVFFVFKQGDGVLVVTPSLRDNLILPGITRTSILTICKDTGVPVQERDLYLSELEQAFKDQRVEEVFLTGSAAGVAPVTGVVCREGGPVHAGAGGRVLSSKLRKLLHDIQHGKTAHVWMTEVHAGGAPVCAGG